MSEFPSKGPVTAEIRLGDGRVEILAEPRQTITVTVEPMEQTDASREAAAKTTVELHGSKLVVHAPELTSGWWRRKGAPIHVAIALPSDSSVELRLASADATCDGAYRSITAHVASGDLVIDRVAGHVTVNTASGNVRANQVGGDLKVNSASGDLTVGSTEGAVQAHSASGHVEIQRTAANVRANTASGDVKIGSARRGWVKVNSASGDVAVGVVTGTSVWMDVTAMSGRARSDLDAQATGGTSGSADLSLHLRSMSGDIHVFRAA